MRDEDKNVQVTESLLEQELTTYRLRLSKRQDIDAEIESMTHLMLSAQEHDETYMARQVLGADSLWRGWLANKRAETLRHLAMAKALELESFDRARLAFSRNEAAKSLARDARERRKNTQDQRAADCLEDLSRLQRNSFSTEFD